MSRIARCANCQERVTVPEGLDENASVCCPFCQAEYSLSEALADATEAADGPEAPPELAAVGSSPVHEGGAEEEHEESWEDVPESDSHFEEASEEESEAESSEGLEIAEDAEKSEEAEEQADEADEPVREAAEEAEQREGAIDEAAEAPGEPPEPKTHEESLQVRCPHCEAEYGLSHLVVVETGAELGPAVAAAVARQVLPSQAGSATAPSLDIWAKADAMPQIDLGDRTPVETVAADAVAFDFAREEAEGEAAPGRPAGLRPPRRKQKSVARELGGWVFGAVAGMVIAYYLLNVIRPESGNFLKIPLPGIPHTYVHSPEWFPSWLQPAPKEPTEEGEDEEAFGGRSPRPGEPQVWAVVDDLALVVQPGRAEQEDVGVPAHVL
jgi:uncharacterized Zn-finger protein